MKNKDYIVLRKILDYCNQVDEACSMFENDFNKFQQISVFQNACCMCILQIGELCKVISGELCKEHGEIPWKAWCGIRDIFAHQYSNLDCESAWETIQEDLPQLKKNVQMILLEWEKEASTD
jgi:uncharacterized protein with HEPN domain